MVGVPAATPVTTPVVILAVAINELLLVQLPLPVASASVIAEPAQTLVRPEMAAGLGLTVTVALTEHEVGSV